MIGSARFAARKKNISRKWTEAASQLQSILFAKEKNFKTTGEK
jgi:hypothetical protein